MINTILDGIENVLNDIISLVTGLGDGADALMVSQNDAMTSLGSLSDIQKNLTDNQNEIQSKIGDMSTMLDDLEMTLLAKMSELETNIEGVAALADRTAGLEAAVNDLGTLAQNSQSDIERQISAFEQFLDTRLASLEMRLGGVADDITSTSEQIVGDMAPVDFSGANRDTTKHMITLYDYSTNVGEFDYNEDDVNIDYNLKFECEETIYISDIQAIPQGNVTDVDNDGDDDVQLIPYYLSIISESYYIYLAPHINPFNETDDSKVVIPDIQLTDIVLLGEYRTIPTVQKPITLEAGDSFTIQTSMDNNVIIDNVDSTYVFSSSATIDPDIKRLLDSKVRIDADKLNFAVDAVPSDVFVIVTGDPPTSAEEDLLRLMKRSDNQPLYNLAKQVDILEISIDWFSGVNDPKCTFTPIGDAVVEYPNQDNTLNVLTTIENIDVSATVNCNGIGTRIADIGDIRIGGAITNHDVGSLTLSAGNQSIRINLNDDLTFRLANEDVDFPLVFTDILQITGTIVPESSPSNVVIEIIYDTAAGNTCTQQ